MDEVGGYKSPAEGGGDSDSDNAGGYVPSAMAKRKPGTKVSTG